MLFIFFVVVIQATDNYQILVLLSESVYWVRPHIHPSLLLQYDFLGILTI